jgi:cytochrome b pre-mRNA-processing protein 3
MPLASFFRRKPHERTGFVLYGHAVAAARQPRPFAEWGVPDSTAGRFELITLTAGLLIRRLKAEGNETGDALGQAVFDAMFSDMDVSLREMGVGDLSVGKRVKLLWESFHGRATAYEAAMTEEADAPLLDAISRNVWAGGEVPAEGAGALAGWARRIASNLANQPVEAFLAGRVQYPAP